MPTKIPFTVEDLRTPERLERVLRLFDAAVAVSAVPPTPIDPRSLANQLAPFLRDLLQSPGAYPLNLQSLLPAVAGATITEDTHAQRTSVFTPPTTQGSVFWETDRTVLYVSASSSGALVWRYAAGEFVSTFANRPTDLGVNDSGFLFYATDQSTVYIWTGAAWDTITRRILFGAFFAIIAANLTADRTWTGFDESGDFVYKTVAAMTASALVLGDTGGADKTGRVKVLGSLGTTTTLLHGNAAGDPTWAAVNLATAEVTGTLPATNGGTGVAYDRVAAVLAFLTQTATLGPTTIASTGTQFLFSYTLQITTADGGSAATVQVSVNYTDQIGATSQTGTAIAVTATNRDRGVFVIMRNTGNVTYTVTVTGAIGTAVYAFHATLQRFS